MQLLAASAGSSRSSHEERGWKSIHPRRRQFRHRRSSYEERGLKWHFAVDEQSMTAVAPRMRSVD